MRSLKLSPGGVAAVFALALLAFALTSPAPAAADDGWHGVVGSGDVNVRQNPTSNSPIIGQISAGSPITVLDWTIGEKIVGMNDVWGHLSGGGYVYSGNIVKGPVSTPPAPAAPTSGRWVDVNLTQQIATAYNGTQPAFSVVVSTGTPGWETPTGTFTIGRRVASETMDSNTLAVGVSQAYHLTDVKYTQYFTQWGHSLHTNYWKWDSPFGVPTSHGCVGMPEQDALKFWNFATSGTPLVIHN